MKLEAQICLKPGGKWHRRVGNTTKCGEPVPGAFVSRDGVIGDDLCENCYSARERLLVLAAKIQRANDDEADPGLYYSPEDAPTDVDEVSDDFDDEEPTDVFEP